MLNQKTYKLKLITKTACAILSVFLTISSTTTLKRDNSDKLSNYYNNINNTSMHLNNSNLLTQQDGKNIYFAEQIIQKARSLKNTKIKKVIAFHDQSLQNLNKMFSAPVQEDKTNKQKQDIKKIKSNKKMLPKGKVVTKSFLCK